MNRIVTETLTPYVKKLSKVLKDFFLESGIFSIRKVDVVDILLKVDKDREIIDVKESTNSRQINALVVDIEKFKKVLISFYKKGKEKRLKRLVTTVHKIEQQIIKILLEKHFLMVYSQDYYFSLYSYHNERKLRKFLTEKEFLCYYLLLSILDTLHHNRKEEIIDKYLYIFSENEPAEELLEKYFKNILSFNNVFLLENDLEKNQGYFLSLNISAWTETSFIDEENISVKNNGKKKYNTITANFISSSSEIKTLYSLKNFYFSQLLHENSTNKRRQRFLSFWGISLERTKFKNLLLIIIKYLNNGEVQLNKEEFEKIEDIISGNGVIYFTKSKELGFLCNNKNRYEVCGINLNYML